MAGRHYRRATGRGLRTAAAVAGVGAVVVLTTGVGASGRAGAVDARAAAAAQSVTLNGEGTWDVNAEMLGWQNDLYGTSGDVNLNYLPEGGHAGREDLLAGNVDYAIAGAPFTSSELAGYTPGASGIIASPVMPSAVGFLLDPPTGGFFVQHNQGNGFDSQPYDGPVREPAQNLAAQILHYNSTDEPTPAGNPYAIPGEAGLLYSEWDNPAIIGTWDQSFLDQYNPSAAVGDTFSPASPTTPEQVLQAEPNEDNLYLDEWVAEQAPSMWSKLQKVYDPTPSPTAPWAPSETPQPSLAVTESPGLDEELGLFASGSTGSSQNLGGVLTAVPPSSLDVVLASQAANIAACNNANQHLQPGQVPANCGTVPPAGQNYEWISVQNRNGDWVTPTPAAIDAAVDATPSPTPTATTGATPLYASTAAVPGAYPLTYVDYLYAPAKGLSIAKTEALATVMRYLVTDGQGELAGNGDGRLSAPLVAQGLAAANHLVASNCPAAGGQVVLTASPGPYDPDLPGIRSLGPVDHCEAVPTSNTPSTTTPGPRTTTTTARSTTTTTTHTTPTTAAPGGGGTVGGDGGGTTTGTTPTSSPTTVAGGTTPTTSKATTAPTTATTLPRVAIAAQTASALPLPVASGTTAGLDKLGALGVGVAAFLLLRRRPAAWVKRIFSG